MVCPKGRKERTRFGRSLGLGLGWQRSIGVASFSKKYRQHEACCIASGSQASAGITNVDQKSSEPLQDTSVYLHLRPSIETRSTRCTSTCMYPFCIGKSSESYCYHLALRTTYWSVSLFCSRRGKFRLLEPVKMALWRQIDTPTRHIYFAQRCTFIWAVHRSVEVTLHTRTSVRKRANRQAYRKQP